MAHRQSEEPSRYERAIFSQTVPEPDQWACVAGGQLETDAWQAPALAGTLHEGTEQGRAIE